MYHALEDEQHPAGARNQGEQLYVVSVDNFREQMQYLYSNGYQTYFICDLGKLDDLPEKGVVITFDDGHESNYTLALPILRAFGFKAEFFITTDWISTKHFLNRNQVIELFREGMEVGSHSASHSYLDDLSTFDLKREFKESKIALEDILGKDITSFSAPGGRIKSSSMVQIARKTGYRILCTSNPGFFRKSSSLFEIPRLAILGRTSLDEFVNIIQLKTVLLLKLRMKTWVFNLSKQMLGNDRYERIRDAILRSMSSLLI